MRNAIQDGGQFYDHATGQLIANYGDTYSIQKARANLARFLAEHPEYRMADDPHSEAHSMTRGGC